MSYRENLLRIKAVHNALGDLRDSVVFVGGATVSLYADRPTVEVRPTDDIDILVELLDYREYSVLEEKLSLRGFQHDIESGVICRYKVQGIVVDIMPTSEKILGFSNRWYPEAFSEATYVTIGDDIVIKIFTPPYFLATKLEAFKGRGNNDGRMSTDFEDIVYLLNNRGAIWEEILSCGSEVKMYLKEEFQKLLENPYIEEWISSSLDFHEQKRTGFILESMQSFVNGS